MIHSQGPILFDTLNFLPSAGKATQKDKDIYQRLLTYRTSITDDSKLYKDLRHSAADITGILLDVFVILF